MIDTEFIKLINKLVYQVHTRYYYSTTVLNILEGTAEDNRKVSFRIQNQQLFEYLMSE